MKCPVCGEEVFEHSMSAAKKCIKDAGINIRGESAVSLLGELGIPVTFNHKHGYIKYGKDDKEIRDSKNMERDFWRICLTSKRVKALYEVEKEVEEQKWQEEM